MLRIGTPKPRPEMRVIIRACVARMLSAQRTERSEEETNFDVVVLQMAALLGGIRCSRSAINPYFLVFIKFEIFARVESDSFWRELIKRVSKLPFVSALIAVTTATVLGGALALAVRAPGRTGGAFQLAMLLNHIFG